MTMLRLQPQARRGGDGAGEALTLEKAMPAIRKLEEEWGCEYVRSEEMLFPPFGGKPGLLLLPELMFRKQGILITTIPGTGHLTIEREEEATTWEDFLMMKLAHTLAGQLQAELYYGDDSEPMLVEPHRFETFEHYVDKVLEHEEDVVKEMKRVWIYTHRKRAVR